MYTVVQCTVDSEYSKDDGLTSLNGNCRVHVILSELVSDTSKCQRKLNVRVLWLDEMDLTIRYDNIDMFISERGRRWRHFNFMCFQIYAKNIW